MTLDANNPAIEDDDLSTTAPNPLEDDLSTTAPNPPDEPVWRMPEPVFRKTSGRLPQSYERDVTAMTDNPVPPAETAAASASVAPTPLPVVKPKSSVLKLILVLLGLGAMTAFLIVFLTIVYYFFLR